MARRRRKARKSSARKPKRGRRLRRLKRNPGGKRKAKAAAFIPVVEVGTSAERGVAEQLQGSRIRGKRRKLSAAQRKSRARRAARNRVLRKRSKALVTRARKMTRGSYKRASLMTQARRYTTLRRFKGKSLKRSPVYKAMHIKANPGFAGIIASAKVLAPQVGVAAVSMVGLAMGGQKLGAFANEKITQIPAGVRPYMPAISTAALTIGGYFLADKFAPKFKGAVFIGGVLGAVVQAIVAGSSMNGDQPNIAGKIQQALTLGDYTTVGNRGYAESGIFRNIGGWNESRDGGAYSNGRPRNTLDNRSEMSINGWNESRDGGAYSNGRPRNTLDNRSEMSLHGLDDNTEFADGEGGVLSGGMFRGPNSR
jgi:hypothetical protein